MRATGGQGSGYGVGAWVSDRLGDRARKEVGRVGVVEGWCSVPRAQGGCVGVAWGWVEPAAVDTVVGLGVGVVGICIGVCIGIDIGSGVDGGSGFAAPSVMGTSRANSISSGATATTCAAATTGSWEVRRRL